MNIKVEAKFSNSNGELQTENLEFIYDALDAIAIKDKGILTKIWI